MSRRSLISAEENLIRSQRRGVPNVRMWSEQETPPQVAWDGYEEEPAGVPVIYPQRVSWQGTSSNSISADGSVASRVFSYPWVPDAEQATPADGADMIMIATSLGRKVTLGPQWTTLASGGALAHSWAVGHRKWAPGAVFNGSLGGLTPDGAYEGHGYEGFAFEGMEGGSWTVDVVHDAVGRTIQFRDDPSPFRFGALCGYPAYVGWDASAPDFRIISNISPRVQLQDSSAPGWASTRWFSTQHERACFRPTRPLPTGAYTLRVYGTATSTWANLIIKYGD